VLASSAWTKTLLNKRVDLQSDQFVEQVEKYLAKLAKEQAKNSEGTKKEQAKNSEETKNADVAEAGPFSSSAMKDTEHEAQKNADVGGESSLRRSLREGTITNFYVAPATTSKPETDEKEIKGKGKNKPETDEKEIKGKGKKKRKGKGKNKAKTSEAVKGDDCSTSGYEEGDAMEANDETIKLFAGFDTICDKIVDMPMSETCLETLIRKLSKKLQQMKQKPPRRPRDNAAIVDHPDLVVKASTIRRREAGDGLFFCPKEGRPKMLPKSTIIARYGGLQMTKGKLDECISAQVLLDERSVLLEAASETDDAESDSSQSLTKNALLLQGFPFAGAIHLSVYTKLCITFPVHLCLSIFTQAWLLKPILPVEQG
jgi:hypothetical protein